ncbi:hypothetical protein [Jiella marina]|uniref:hypothetical protein n=1 Tax=Jiella sp. LLJ827 TaxID=2917712 RepID=UPI0021011BA7|nr:hypothetical protein [Jiella sp. LLJ827]MCQ0988603.1 hypothetical protein [Jiella sp. LLJ827]
MAQEDVGALPIGKDDRPFGILALSGPVRLNSLRAVQALMGIGEPTAAPRED